MGWSKHDDTIIVERSLSRIFFTLIQQSSVGYNSGNSVGSYSSVGSESEGNITRYSKAHKGFHLKIF